MRDETNGLYFIAGGTGGIGSEVARRLRVQGSEVALAARNEARLEECARELGARAAPMDATQPEAVARAFDAALANGDRLMGVVNCIGTILLKPAHLTSDEEWRTTLDTNLTSSFLLLREAARRMMTSGGGSIVFCSTVAAERGLFNHEAIAAAKAGVEGLTRAAAQSGRGSASARAVGRAGRHRVGHLLAVVARAKLGHRTGAPRGRRSV